MLIYILYLEEINYKLFIEFSWPALRVGVDGFARHGFRAGRLSPDGSWGSGGCPVNPLEVREFGTGSGTPPGVPKCPPGPKLEKPNRII